MQREEGVSGQREDILHASFLTPRIPSRSCPPDRHVTAPLLSFASVLL